MISGCLKRLYEGIAGSLAIPFSFLTSSPTFALRDSGGGFPLVGDG
ncbi:hypothetical protein GXR48_004476 [Salmonella enterica]|nr:hypothetical protein [Salmonella enterica subsp. enterica]EDW2120745.1 hypothetical protein [Salmonella enterica subsp. enterica serovar Bareilly]EED2314331.1 hypothetical protein [Salmonella enterica subsp. enterica]EED7758822.1 hypothetical protein [Salmonella enterica subsp. enterica]EEG2442318.1 hypothetical protein [Salmonella enterica]